MEAENRYGKGLNAGYLLAKHKPELLSEVIKDLSPTNDYLEGIFEGKEQFELENTRNQVKELKQLRNDSKNRETDLDREL